MVLSGSRERKHGRMNIVLVLNWVAIAVYALALINDVVEKRPSLNFALNLFQLSIPVVTILYLYGVL